MTVNSLSAANAYQNQLKLMQGGGNSDESSGATGSSSFADLVKSAISEAADAQYQGENMKMQSLSGKVDLTNLVTAVTNAELSLNTVIAVRDRVINAYQDIIKMAI